MTNKMAKYELFAEELKPLSDLLGIQLAPVQEMLSVYPDEFMGMEFYQERDNGAVNARKHYSPRTQAALIKSFRSHEWKVTADIYGHNGLHKGGCCLRCKQKFKLPFDPRREYSDDAILAYHYIYGRHKRFGGRITKCKNDKHKKNK